MIIAMTAMLHRDSDGGISPSILRTFSERNSCLSLRLSGVFISASVAKFELIFYEIEVCSLLSDEGVV